MFMPSTLSFSTHVWELFLLSMSSKEAANFFSMISATRDSASWSSVTLETYGCLVAGWVPSVDVFFPSLLFSGVLLGVLIVPALFILVADVESICSED